MMRRRTDCRLTADEWARRLDSLMRAVLAAPERYDRSTVVWAQWRRRWLAEHAAHREGGSNLCHDLPDTAPRLKFLREPTDLMPREAAEGAECD
jgi:hypothetical protein